MEDPKTQVMRAIQMEAAMNNARTLVEVRCHCAWSVKR